MLRCRAARPQLGATPTAQRTRLALCRLTAATLRLNLELLGIETLDRL